MDHVSGAAAARQSEEEKTARIETANAKLRAALSAHEQEVRTAEGAVPTGGGGGGAGETWLAAIVDISRMSLNATPANAAYPSPPPPVGGDQLGGPAVAAPGGSGAPALGGGAASTPAVTTSTTAVLPRRALHALASHGIHAASGMRPFPAGDERSLPHHVVRLAGEADGFELVVKLGLAGVSWLWETGLAAHLSPPPPLPPPPASAHVAASQTPAAGERSFPHHVVCLSGEVGEDEVVDKLGLAGLNWLRATGLLTYPSPVLGRLFDRLPDIFAAEVLPRLDPADRAVVAQVGPLWLAAVVASSLPRAGKFTGMPLKLNEFVGTVPRLAWAKDNRCPWDSRTCALAAAGGHLAALKWLREHHCPWDDRVQDERHRDQLLDCCSLAARGGHLEVLKYLRQHGFPCGVLACASAARGGHLQVMQWLREHHCPWEGGHMYEAISCCALAAGGGHLEMLKWLRARECLWDGLTCAAAARGGCSAGAYTRPLFGSTLAHSVG